MPQVLILSVGADSAISQARDLVLQSAGYLVESVHTIGEGANCFLARDFDLVILCHSIPLRERDRLIALVRASGSRTPVVSLLGDSCQHDTFANATLEDDPHKLLVGIKEVLAKAARSAGWEVIYSNRKEQINSSGKKPSHSPATVNGKG